MTLIQNITENRLRRTSGPVLHNHSVTHINPVLITQYLAHFKILRTLFHSILLVFLAFVTFKSQKVGLKFFLGAGAWVRTCNLRHQKQFFHLMATNPLTGLSHHELSIVRASNWEQET